MAKANFFRGKKKKKKKNLNQNTGRLSARPSSGPPPSTWPCTPAACLPPAANKNQSRLEPLSRSANEMKGSAKAPEAREGLNLWSCLAFWKKAGH